MRFVITAVFILGLMTGAVSADVNFAVEDFATHRCIGEGKGQVILLRSVKVEDPLGSSTCSDSGKIDQITMPNP